MSFLLLLVLGGLSGWIASRILGSPNGQSIVMDVVLGTLGAILGAVIMTWFGNPETKAFNFYSLLVSIVAPVVLVWLTRIIDLPRQYTDRIQMHKKSIA